MATTRFAGGSELLAGMRTAARESSAAQAFNFDWKAYVALDRGHVERKVAALAKYASQQHRKYADTEYVWNLARTNGINAGREDAEVFEVYSVVG